MTNSAAVLPSHQTVIRQQRDFTVGVTHNVPLSMNHQSSTVLIKTVALTLNPCDWKMPSRFPCPGAITGCDFAGTIVQVGADVRRSLQIGDRVFGAVHGSDPANPKSGAFAQYVAADPEFLFVAPKDMAWETAAAFGAIGIGTIGMALFCSLKPPGTLDRPAESPCYVLVNGGASASGTIAIQCLKHAGLIPIATCSTQSSNLVLSYGAEKVFDYKSPNCAGEIRAYTKSSLKYVLDCIATSSAVELCYAAIGRLGGRYTALELPPPVAKPRKTIAADTVMGMAILGKEIALSEGYHRPADPECREFGLKWFQTVQKLLDQKQLQPHPATVMSGGFEGMSDGLKILREGKKFGKKLVYFV